jgi:hypothetical protein
VALNIVTGSIAVPGATGNFDISLSASFDPKAIMVVATPNAADGRVNHASMSIGFGTYRGSVVQQGFQGVFCEDAIGTSDTYRRGGSGALALLMDATGAIDLEIDLVSMTTGAGSKVTLNAVNLHTTASVRLFYTIWGGSDVEDAQAHVLTPPSGAGGTYDMALGAGFGHPTVVLFGSSLQPNDTSAHNNADLAFGWGVLAGSTAGVAFSSLDAQATEASSQRIDNARLQVFSGTTVEQDFTLAAEAGWPTDGYEISTTEWDFAGDIATGLALRLSSNVTVTQGHTAVRTSLGDTDHAVGTSTPKGFILAHTRQTSQGAIDSTSTDAALIGVGMVDGSGNERWAGVWDDDGQGGSSVASSAQSTTKALQLYLPSTDAIDTEADGTVSGSNFRLSFTDAAPAAHLYNWLAFGEVGVTPPAATPRLLGSTGVGT